MKSASGSRGAMALVCARVGTLVGKLMRNLLTALCAVAFLAPFLGSSAAAAEEPGVAALRREVNALNSAVLDLQARVRQLEKSSAAPAAGSAQVPTIAPAASAPTAVPAAAPMTSAAKKQSAPQASGSQPAVITAAPAGTGAGYLSPEALLRQRWSSIDTGMIDTRVHELLGEPSKKFKLNGRTVWYYYYPGTGVGSVFFTDAGKVSSEQSPFGWNW